jgi:hypothetical protein
VIHEKHILGGLSSSVTVSASDINNHNCWTDDFTQFNWFFYLASVGLGYLT